VNFTKLEEKVVSILAETLNLKQLIEVKLGGNLRVKMFAECGLRERVCCVSG